MKVADRWGEREAAVVGGPAELDGMCAVVGEGESDLVSVSHRAAPETEAVFVRR